MMPILLEESGGLAPLQHTDFAAFTSIKEIVLPRTFRYLLMCIPCGFTEREILVYEYGLLSLRFSMRKDKCSG